MRDVEDSASARVKSLSLENFRNYERLAVSLGPAFNVLAGANGQGKTNFLEALYLVATSRLLRGRRDAEAIREGEERAEVAAELAPSNTLLGVLLERGIRKRAKLNGLPVPRAADLIGRLPCVCVTSADMDIVRGEPAERRLFLDLELSSQSAAYLRHLTVYKRALDQRNALVRAAKEQFPEEEVWLTWEEQLATHGIALRELRKAFVDAIQAGLRHFHGRMGEGEDVRATYLQKGEEASAGQLASALAASRSLDVHRGTTGVGPHRDDLFFEIGRRDARLFGSQGQQRTCVIALKLATLQLSTQERGATPLLLLDDIFSDLDEGRRRMLVEIVLDVARQTVLTCTEANAAGRSILDQACVFAVKNGTVSPQ